MFDEKTTQEQDLEENEAEFEDEDADTTDFDDDEAEDDWDDEDDDWDDEDDDEGKPADEDDDSEEETFTVKYYGEEKKLTREQLIEAAQKGLNYDKVKGKLDAFENGAIYKAMKAGADKAKMTIDEYAAYLNESIAADAQLDAEKVLKEKYPNAPAEMIREMAKLQAEKADSATKAAAQTAEQKAWAEAMNEYPDLALDKIPQDVLDAVKGGKTPLMAMKDHEIAQLRKEKRDEAARDKNELNKRTAPGSVKSRHGDRKRDPFLEVFDSDD